MISSIKDPIIKRARDLHTCSGRKDHQSFLLEGEEMIRWALESRWIQFEAILYDEKHSPQVLNLVTQEKVSCFPVQSGVFRKVQSSVHQVSVIAIVKWQLTEMATSTIKRVLILDDVCDPGNIGTLIRVAYAFEIDLIVFISKTKDLLSRKTIVASRGKVFKLPQKCFDSSKNAYVFLKSLNCCLVATDSKASASVKRLKPLLGDEARPLGIILGNETTGVSSSLLEHVEHVLCIPIPQDLDSLNVGVAGGIILYELWGT